MVEDNDNKDQERESKEQNLPRKINAWKDFCLVMP